MFAKCAVLKNDSRGTAPLNDRLVANSIAVLLMTYDIISNYITSEFQSGKWLLAIFSFVRTNNRANRRSQNWIENPLLIHLLKVK